MSKQNQKNITIKNQIGCGYCKHEKNCKEYDSKINKDKLGCKKYKHHESK